LFAPAPKVSGLRRLCSQPAERRKAAAAKKASTNLRFGEWLAECRKIDAKAEFQKTAEIALKALAGCSLCRCGTEKTKEIFFEKIAATGICTVEGLKYAAATVGPAFWQHIGEIVREEIEKRAEEMQKEANFRQGLVNFSKRAPQVFQQHLADWYAKTPGVYRQVSDRRRGVSEAIERKSQELAQKAMSGNESNPALIAKQVYQDTTRPFQEKLRYALRNPQKPVEGLGSTSLLDTQAKIKKYPKSRNRYIAELRKARAADPSKHYMGNSRLDVRTQRPSAQLPDQLDFRNLTGAHGAPTAYFYPDKAHSSFAATTARGNPHAISGTGKKIPISELDYDPHTIAYRGGHTPLRQAPNGGVVTSEVYPEAFVTPNPFVAGAYARHSPDERGIVAKFDAANLKPFATTEAKTHTGATKPIIAWTDHITKRPSTDPDFISTAVARFKKIIKNNPEILGQSDKRYTKVIPVAPWYTPARDGGKALYEGVLEDLDKVPVRGLFRRTDEVAPISRAGSKSPRLTNNEKIPFTNSILEELDPSTFVQNDDFIKYLRSYIKAYKPDNIDLDTLIEAVRNQQSVR